MDDIFVFATASFLCLTSIYLTRKYGKRNRKNWVNLYLRGRSSDCSYARDFHAMNQYPSCFRENFHMDDNHFEYISNKVKHHLEPIKYSRPDVIPPRAKLAMVLERIINVSRHKSCMEHQITSPFCISFYSENCFYID